MRATSRPGPTVQAGFRICWRCGIEFPAHARLATGAPCRDCREFLKRETKKSKGSKMTENETARLVGLLLLAIADGDTVNEISLMREITKGAGAIGLVESMASVALSIMATVDPEHWRETMLEVINDLDAA